MKQKETVGSNYFSIVVNISNSTPNFQNKSGAPELFAGLFLLILRGPKNKGNTKTGRSPAPLT